MRSPSIAIPSIAGSFSIRFNGDRLEIYQEREEY